MKFLVDAQLLRRFANWLNETGQDALHTLDLPRKNLTTDSEIIARAQQDGRIVVTKDADFVRSFLHIRISGDRPQMFCRTLRAKNIRGLSLIIPATEGARLSAGLALTFSKNS